MKVNKKTISNFIQSILLITISIVCINMGGGAEKTTILEPAFVPLEDNQGIYSGMIYDDKNEIEVKDISFTGHTAIGGIRKETDDSVNKIELSKLKEIKIIEPYYISKKYSDKEYILADAISITGEPIKEILIPRQVIICAVDKKTQMEKAWFLYKISKITINHREIKTATGTEEEPVGIFGQIKSGVKSVVDKISY